jgi:hypothetical protein
MKPNKDSIVILASTGLLAFLIVVVSLIGVLTTDYYSKETLNWQIQSFGQDMIDLFLITPVLLATGIIAAKKNRTAALIWAGVLTYIIYTFIIYCFDVHFNSLFPVYCLILCLSFYSFLWFVYKQVKKPAINKSFSGTTTRITGIYFILIAALFYFLWFAEIIPAIINTEIPENLKLSGLPTNPVHVIDLSVFLPAIFITGVFILRRHPQGSVFAAIFLCFFILMDITIAWLSFSMSLEGLGSDGTVIFVMMLLAVISTILLFFNIKNNKENSTLSLNDPASRCIITNIN